MANTRIIFNKETVKSVLLLFRKKLDENNFIVKVHDKDVLSPEGEVIHISELGGIIKVNGVTCFIKNDINSMRRYFVENLK